VGLSTPVFTVLVCTLGGLIVGVLVKIFGDHSGIFAELMLEFGRTGRFNYRHAPGIVVTALPSLIAGGSLGPEAPLIDACGSVGTLVSDKLKLDERETRALGYSGLSGMLAAMLTLLTARCWAGIAGQIFPTWTLFPARRVGLRVAFVLASSHFSVCVSAFSFAVLYRALG
jgi:hypothetical protein